MKTTVSTKGQIILPTEIREQDGIKPGQEFEVARPRMTFLVDANVLTELTKPDWLSS